MLPDRRRPAPVPAGRTGIRRPACADPKSPINAFSCPAGIQHAVAALRGGGRIARAVGGNPAEKAVLRRICPGPLRPGDVRRRQISGGRAPRIFMPAPAARRKMR